MEQELRFGLDLGRLAFLKTTTFEQLLKLVFSKFSWAKEKKKKNIAVSALKSSIMKLFFFS